MNFPEILQKIQKNIKNLKDDLNMYKKKIKEMENNSIIIIYQFI